MERSQLITRAARLFSEIEGLQAGLRLRPDKGLLKPASNANYADLGNIESSHLSLTWKQYS